MLAILGVLTLRLAAWQGQHDTQHNDIQQNDTQQNGLNCNNQHYDILLAVHFHCYTECR